MWRHHLRMHCWGIDSNYCLKKGRCRVVREEGSARCQPSCRGHEKRRDAVQPRSKPSINTNLPYQTLLAEISILQSSCTRHHEVGTCQRAASGHRKRKADVASRRPNRVIGIGRTRTVHLQFEPRFFFSLNEYPQWMSSLPDFEAGSKTWCVSIAPHGTPIYFLAR
jgi:hypothetical protein